MSEIIECIKARSSITSFIATSDNNLAYCTKLHGAKLLNSEDCNVKYNFTNQHLNSDTTAVTFNSNGNLLAFANLKAIYIADIQKKEILKIIPIDSSQIQLLIFDESSNYLIAGNENGRVIQYDWLSASAIARMCSFPYDESDRKNIRKNYVSAFSIHKNRLACTGFGGAIIILDIYSRANKIVLQNKRSRINALHFIDDDTILSADFNGLVSIFSIKCKKLIKEIETPLSRIRQVISMPDKNFIMLCSNTNYVSIIDITNYKLIHQHYAEFKDNVIRLAKIDEKNIAVALKNGVIEKIVIPCENELKSLILHNSLDKAYELTEKEPMLKESVQYKELEKLYNKIYNKATIALINQNISLANQLLEMFKELPSKKKDISSLFISFKHYNNLKLLYIGKKFTIAYALCARYVELENTPIFRKMEEIWRDAFKNAQRQILFNKPGNARAILNDYKTIPSKKELIDLLINQNDDFVQFIKALNKKDYARASLLANKNKLLTKAPSYAILKNELDFKLEQIKTFIYQGDIQKAQTAISIINNIVHLKKQTIAFNKECKHLQTLQDYYKMDNFKKCYETIDVYPHLYHTELGELLEGHWKKLIEQCETFALKGSINDIKKTLGELVELKSRAEKIGDLFRLAFQIRIKTYMSKRSFKNVEKLIYSYIDTFGIDSEINLLMKKYEKKTDKKLAITQDPTISRNSWIYSDLVK